MAEEYKAYLAANVLNIVTYRSLSRALKVHNNVAKKMLYEFHRQQNSKKPGSVHAIYLLSGNIKIEEVTKVIPNNQGDGEDETMQSSPFIGSSMPHQNGDEDKEVKKVITLVREEHLEAARVRYDEVSSIHVYSLGPSYIQNIQILSDCTREISLAWVKEDPLVVGKHYGVIQNQGVKRRTGPRPSGITAPSSSIPKAIPIASNKIDTKTAPDPDDHGKSSTKTADQPVSSAPVKQDRPARTAKKQVGKPPMTKREASDIFKSFSKAKPKIERRDTASSVDSTLAVATPVSEVQSNAEDEPMKDASEDEQEEDLILTSSKSTTSQRGTKAEREEKLRKMMEEDEDESMDDDAPEASPADDETSPQPSPSVPASQEDPAEPPVVVSGGRRRGRRKVMKKKTLKDEEGYLVTKEEPAWESFSEDEPVPSAASSNRMKQQQPPASSAGASSATATAKGKKTGAAGGKPGQGNIMSFFGRK